MIQRLQHIVFAISAVLSLALLDSCSDNDPVTGKQLSVESEIELDSDTVYVGDWVGFSLKFENKGDEPIELTFPDTCRAGCDVIAPDGSVIFRPQICASEKLGLVLPPQGVVTLRLGISTLRSDMADVDWPLAEDQLPPGEYQLRAGLLGHRFTIPWAEKTFVVVN